MKINGIVTEYERITGNTDTATINLTMIDASSNTDVTQSLIGHLVKWDADTGIHVADNDTIEGIIYDAFCHKYGGHADFPSWDADAVECLDADALDVYVNCLDGDTAEIAEIIAEIEAELIDNYNYIKGGQE